MIDAEKIVSDFSRAHDLKIQFSSDMPPGYETANGTFDISKNTLFLNTAALANMPDYEALFYLFHELRHVLQYTTPQAFPEVLQRSLDYVLMYDGTCYQRLNGNWAECKLEGNRQHLIDAYLGQPYERDANAYAYEQVKGIYGPSKELDALYAFWGPKELLSDGDYLEIYRTIDLACMVES